MQREEIAFDLDDVEKTRQLVANKARQNECEVKDNGNGAAGEGEAIVRVNILDVNDNAPVFENASSEIIASVPTTAEYGHPVAKIQVILLLSPAQGAPWMATSHHPILKADFHHQI